LKGPGKIAKEYLLGLIAGFIMMSAVCLILTVSGQIKISGFGIGSSAVKLFFINLIMWFPQGASEELLFRGYMIPRIESRYKRAVAVFFSSLLFSVFHSLNMGYTPLASVNLFLIAVLFALIYIKTGSIWMTSAIHTMWNLSQGNIYGLQVSGNEAHAAIINTAYAADAKDIITGGAFGPEGGLATTAVAVVCLIIATVLLVLKKRKEKKL
jgi:membrane protease YdiL (CAAX protease family)